VAGSRERHQDEAYPALISSFWLSKSQPCGGQQSAEGRSPGSRPSPGPVILALWPSSEFAPSGLSVAHIHRYRRVSAPAVASGKGRPDRAKSAGLQAESQIAPVAQLDRASVYGTEGREFESLRARYESPLETAGFLILRGAARHSSTPCTSTKAARPARGDTSADRHFARPAAEAPAKQVMTEPCQGLPELQAPGERHTVQPHAPWWRPPDDELRPPHCRGSQPPTLRTRATAQPPHAPRKPARVPQSPAPGLTPPHEQH
jgi:hypothetical protein